MKTKEVLSCLLVIAAVTASQAAYLDTALLARYVCRSRADSSRVMVPGSCSQYYLCQGGKAELTTCPHFYDALNKQCVNKNPGCVETFSDIPICEGPCCGISNKDYAVDATNPSIYYLCKNNCVAETNVCPNGLMFDLVKLECSSPSTCSECTTSKPPCETTTTTCAPTTAKPTATTTPRRTTAKTSSTTTILSTTAPCTTTTIASETATKTPCTTTTTAATPCTTTTTHSSSTTTTPRSRPTITTTTTTTCAPTTTTYPRTTVRPVTTSKAPCKQETTTTTCTTTTPPPCTTTKAPCKQSEVVTGSSHYVLPLKMSDSEIEDHALYACADKPEGYMVPSLTKCNEYFICRNGHALPVSCGKKYFNVKTNSCDLPSNTGCIQANLV